MEEDTEKEEKDVNNQTVIEKERRVLVCFIYFLVGVFVIFARLWLHHPKMWSDHWTSENELSNLSYLSSPHATHTIT